MVAASLRVSYGACGNELSLDAATTNLAEQASEEERSDAATVEWRNRQQIQHREVC